MTADRTPEPQQVSDLPSVARITFIVWLGVEGLLAFSALALFASAVLGNVRVGAYFLLILFSTRFVVGYFMRGSLREATGDLADLSEGERRWLYVGAGFLVVTLLGVCLTPTRSNAVALIIVIGLVGHITCHLGAALSSYRRVMARPWPTVAPLTDEDWW